MQSAYAEPSPVPQPQVVGEPYVRVVTAPNDWKAPPFVGSPTLVRLESGDLLFCHDLFSKGSDQDTAYFLVSEDDGKTWEKRSELQGIFWPSVFRCESGLYVIGIEPGSRPPYADVCIARSEDEGGTWSEPVAVTNGLAAHTGNTGVLISKGRVTVSFEVAPQLCQPTPKTVTREEWKVADADLDTREFVLDVADPAVFAPHSLVRFEYGDSRLHVRVLAVNETAKTLTLRPERWTAVDRFPKSPVNSPGPWTFPKGTAIEIASGTVGNNRDFWAVAADADETANLCDPDAWRLSNPVGNPAYTHARVLADLFDWNAVPRDAQGRPKAVVGSAWAGWLEGVLVRMDHPGGDGSILNLMRVAGASTGNISARIRVEDGGDALTARFDKFAPDPGFGVTHGCVRYDPESKLYWLASNVNRDSTRDLTGIPLTGNTAVQERSNLALFYSRNCADWFMAGLVAYRRDWVHSFHYPHFVIDGDDLLFAVRSHIESPLTEKTIHKGKGKTADNHNSNAATFHRVPDFRNLVNKDFIQNYEFQ